MTIPSIESQNSYAEIIHPLKSASEHAARCVTEEGSSHKSVTETECSRGYVANLASMAPMLNVMEPIAIIGLALKFPQGAESPQSFWDMLIERRSAVTDIPPDRFNLGAFYKPGPKIEGVLNVRRANFIKEDIAGFDPTFFSISPSEAESMDPQQRLLLETTFHALENAGISLKEASATGAKTSVHVGSFMRDYDIMLARDPEMLSKYKSTGNGFSLLANRISWFYNFRGPSISLDTACSSSLTALHLACQSLRMGETNMASFTS